MSIQKSKNELPKCLVRDDGERFLSNGDGTYSMEHSKQSPPYRYNFADLINLGCFKIETDDLILSDGLPPRKIGNFHLVRTKEDYEKIYYYKSKIKKYPREYPCVVKIESEGGGIGGDYMQYYATYFPRNVQSNFAYCLGLSAAWHPL